MFGFFKKKQLPEPDASQIVPRIKHTNFLQALREMGTGPDDTPVTEPLVADLLVTYAFDLPDMFQMVVRLIASASALLSRNCARWRSQIFAGRSGRFARRTWWRESWPHLC